jgi:ribonucleotide reductase alpha subunit
LVYGDKSTWSKEVWHEAGRLEHYMDNFAIIPAGRQLWASGVEGRQFLYNCVSGDTAVHTRNGVVPIGTLTGSTVDVLSEGGVYRPAAFYSYGKQALYRVKLSRGEEFLATAGHEWIIRAQDALRDVAWKRVTTVDLAGKRLPFNPAPRPEEDAHYETGFAHGVVYGDGSQSGERSTMVALFGTKRELRDRVEKFSRNGAIEHEDHVYIGTLPSNWKMLPAKDATRSYWRGFLNGLISTDGSVNKGSVVIDQSDVRALGVIRNGAMLAGYIPTGIKKTREISPFTGAYAPSFRLTLRGWSVSRDDLVRSDQREVFHPENAPYHTVTVESVEPTGRVEEVYCCVEPETHTMTIGSGVLTGQCHVSGWGEKFSDHFDFTFMRLMEGGGVGANYSMKYIGKYGAPKRRVNVSIVCDDEHDDHAELSEFLAPDETSLLGSLYVVDDSREGWSEAMTWMLDTYFTKDDPTPEASAIFDVSHVRPSGSPLVTFGGTASGPAPFAKMMLEVSKVMNRSYDNGVISPIDAMEIDHAISECVVSGGVRRSARMSIVAWDDPYIMDFLRCKTDTGLHWTTNISVEIDNDFISNLELEPDLKKCQDMRAWIVHQTVCEAMLKNGEPGYWNKDLANVGEVSEVMATNPCLTGDTVIATIDGPRTFKELAENGEDVQVYSWHPKTKKPVVRWMRNPRLTRKNTDVVRVVFDSGLEVRCTPDHKFFSFRGEKVEAQHLRVGQSIRAFSASRDSSGHERIHGWDSKRNASDHQWTHRMLWENLLGVGSLPDGVNVAHLDGDGANNNMDNLALMTEPGHRRYDMPSRQENGMDGHSPNHKVMELHYAGKEDVYNGTVDDSHTYVILDPEPIAGHMSGIVSANCGEIPLESWEACNLGHVNLDYFIDPEIALGYDYHKLAEAHRLMARFLVRSTFGDISDPRQRVIQDKNRRIGVGHLGVQGFWAKQGIKYSEVPCYDLGGILSSKGLLRRLKQEVRMAAHDYAFELRIPEPVKVTTVAPTGSIAKLPGVTEGIHPVYSRWYERRIRFSKRSDKEFGQVMDYMAQGFKVEDDVYDSSGMTSVVVFPTEDILVAQVRALGIDPAVVESADEISLEDMLAFQAMYQEHYADNAVAFTVNVPDGSLTVARLSDTLKSYLPKLKGTTLMVDASREQAPYTRITEEQYAVAAAKLVEDSTDESCASGACPVKLGNHEPDYRSYCHLHSD